jgi:hypothetical protein
MLSELIFVHVNFMVCFLPFTHNLQVFYKNINIYFTAQCIEHRMAIDYNECELKT